MASQPFRFKKFLVNQEGVAHAVGTDSVLLGAWASTDDATRVLDIGTGTGVLALQVAQRNPYCTIDALEIDGPSAACARRNFKESAWAERLNIFEIPVQQWAQQAENQYDLIISNPPFFSATTYAPDPARRSARSTVTLTTADLANSMQQLLAPDGRCCVILPVQEGQLLCELAALRGLFFTRITMVRARPDKPVERFLLQFERNPYTITKNELVLRTSTGDYSETYRQLTADFYYKTI